MSTELLAVIREAMPYVEEHAEYQDYGSYHGGDPRLFHPDEECSTPEERERHRADCVSWDAGTPNPQPDVSHWKHLPDGTVAHLNIQPYGLGTFTYVDEEASALLARMRAALGEMAEKQSVDSGP
jgi:hypothetical protein